MTLEGTWKKKRVGLLLGGRSPEREVSLQSGKNCGDALRSLGYPVTDIDVGLDVAEKLKGIDVAFIALHGRWGEDGCIQGLLETLQIPYTHSGVLGSAVAMNKLFSKSLFTSLGIKTPFFQLISPSTKAFTPRSYPCVVKPNAQGSSIGVSIVKQASDLPRAIALAGQFGEQILVEEYIRGREINVAVLDGDVLGSVEIRTSREFYDYEAKYISSDTVYLVPAPLAIEEEQRLFAAAGAAYRALGCSGAARVDAIVDQAGQAWMLEANTLPGMTSHSLVPKIAAHRGIGFADLVERMLEGASLKA